MVQGDGLSKQTAFRPKIYQYVPREQADRNFWNWTNQGIRQHQYVLVQAPVDVLDLIDADTDIQALSPRVDSLDQMQGWLDNSSTAFQNLAALELDQVPTDWITAAHTNRQIMKYLLKWHWLCGSVMRLKDPDAKQFIMENLGTQVGTLPLPVRQKVSTWMENKGLDTSWITGTNTVRQVLRYILDSIAFPTPGIGPLKF